MIAHNAEMKTLVIGVTGNIGSGKSTVCQLLAKLGATTIDADKLAHETYKPYSPAWQKLVDTFGKDILAKNEEIDHQKLGKIVFSDSSALARLNQIVHPEARRMAQEKIKHCRRHGAKIIALEATLLIEAGWTDLVDKVWLVVAPKAEVIQRLAQDKGMTEPQVLVRLKSQMSVEEKMKYSHEIIYNDVDINQLQSRVTELWHELENQI